MSIKWIGAMLVMVGCGGVGFTMAAAYKREEWMLRCLIGALDYMTCELQFRLTPLPALCRQAGRECRGAVGKVLTDLAAELENQIAPDADSCMYAALSRSDNLPRETKQALRLLGTSLGRFDLQGQLRGLEQVRGHCRRILESLSRNREQRLRSYQTLGICAGAALAILFV